MKTKTCAKCKEVKPVSEFHKSRNHKGGLTSRCKVCRAEYDRVYYQTNQAHQNRQRKKRLRSTNDRTLELAHRQRLPWEDWEDEFVMADNGLTEYQKAVNLGRSYDSVKGRKYQIRKKARNELTTDNVRV